MRRVSAVARRLRAAVLGWRWAQCSIDQMRREIRADGLDVVVAAPPTTAPGSLRAARARLRVDRATCLERSLVVQRWWASNGIALDVIVGVRHPDRTDGDMAHAWVEHYDADWSDRYGEIRRVAAPEGRPPRRVDGVELTTPEG